MYQEAINRYLNKHGYERINLKAVLFDMDGVLFNSMPNHARSWHKVMVRMGFGLSEQEAYMHEGRTGADTLLYELYDHKDAARDRIVGI